MSLSLSTRSLCPPPLAFCNITPVPLCLRNPPFELMFSESRLVHFSQQQMLLYYTGSGEDSCERFGAGLGVCVLTGCGMAVTGEQKHKPGLAKSKEEASVETQSCLINTGFVETHQAWLAGLKHSACLSHTHTHTPVEAPSTSVWAITCLSPSVLVCIQHQCLDCSFSVSVLARLSTAFWLFHGIATLLFPEGCEWGVTMATAVFDPPELYFRQQQLLDLVATGLKLTFVCCLKGKFCNMLCVFQAMAAWPRLCPPRPVWPPAAAWTSSTPCPPA